MTRTIQTNFYAVPSAVNAKMTALNDILQELLDDNHLLPDLNTRMTISAVNQEIQDLLEESRSFASDKTIVYRKPSYQYFEIYDEY